MYYASAAQTRFCVWELGGVGARPPTESLFTRHWMAGGGDGGGAGCRR